MKMLTLATAAVVALATAVPAMAQGSMSTPGQRPLIGRAPANQPSGGSPGYQANTYVRRPSSRTPTDVGNMAFPDPSQTPSGNLPAVSVGR